MGCPQIAGLVEHLDPVGISIFSMPSPHPHLQRN